MTTGPAAGTVTLRGFARTSGTELLRFAYLLTGDRHRAEGLLQDVLLAMHRRFGDGSLPLDNPTGYARRALANQNVSWSRRGSSTEVVTDVAAWREGSVPADDPADRDALWQALRRLPVRPRTVLVLRPDSAITPGLRAAFEKVLASIVWAPHDGAPSAADAIP